MTYAGDIETYVHRIGRTARIGHTGRSISFFDHETDVRLAKPLVNILSGAQQEVPQFLVEMKNSLVSPTHPYRPAILRSPRLTVAFDFKDVSFSYVNTCFKRL